MAREKIINKQNQSRLTQLKAVAMFTAERSEVMKSVSCEPYQGTPAHCKPKGKHKSTPNIIMSYLGQLCQINLINVFDTRKLIDQ